MARPDIYRMGQLREINRAPGDPKGGDSVVTSEHNSGHRARMQLGVAQATIQVTPVTETKPILLDDGCSFCDVALSLPMSAPDGSMVVGDI